MTKPIDLYRTFVMLVTLVTWVSTPAHSQTVQQNTWVTNGPVYAMVRDSGTVYIGGDFSYVGPPFAHSAAINAASGTVVSGFPSANGYVFAAVSDGAGGWYIGGDFTAVAGVPRNRLAHVRSDNTVGPWNPGADNTVGALGFDGTVVYAGGFFSLVGGQQRNFLAAINGTSGAVTTWNPNPNGPIYAIEIVGTSSYVGGAFTFIGGQSRNYIAAINSIGNATAFSPNANAPVRTIVNGGNVLYLGGEFTLLLDGQVPRSRLAAVDPSSGFPTPWSPRTNDIVFAMALLGPNLYIGGRFQDVSGQPRQRLAAIDTGGNVTFWNPGANDDVFSMTISGTSVYLGGVFTNVGGQPRGYLAAVGTSTGAVTPWNPSASGPVHVLRIAGTNAFAGGEFGSVGGVSRLRLAALDASTGAATSWNPFSDGSVEALVLDAGVLYTGGSFTLIGGQQRNRIAAISTATGQATAWNPGVDDTIHALALSGTTIYVGGRFTSVGGQARNQIAAVSTTTGAVTAWNPNANSPVLALAVDGTTVYAGGFFTTIGGQTRNNIAGLSVATGTATAWNPNASGPVHAMVISGTTMYVGGEFLTIGGQPRSSIAALNLATGTATAWNPSADGIVRAIRPAGPLVYLAGGFLVVGTQQRVGFASVLASNGTVTSWNPMFTGGTGDFPEAHAIVQRENIVHVGGNFTGVLNAGRHNLMAFTDPALAPVFAATPSVLNFGNVNVGASSTDTVVVTNNGASTIQMPSVTTTNTEFSVQPSSAVIAPGTSRTFSVTFTPASAGPKTGRVRFIHNGPSSPDSITVNGTGVTATFSVSPTSLNFGGVPVDSTRLDSVTVTNGGSAPLTVSSVTSTHPAFSVAPSNAAIPSGGSARFFISFRPATAGVSAGHIRFVHSATGSPDSVSVTGTGVTAGIAFTSRSVNFGDVEIGTGINQTIGIINIGGAQLRVDSLRIRPPGSPEFSILGSSGPLPPIAPGDTSVVILRFAPQIEGLRSAVLLAYSNATPTPDSVFMQGIGFTPVLQINVGGDTLVGGTAIVTMASPGGFQIQRSTLFFRQGGGSTFDSLTMTQSGSNFSAAVPPSVLTIRGLEYFIQVVHAQGILTFPSINPDVNPAIIRTRVSAAVASGEFLRRKYKMVSVPIDLADRRIATVFEDDYGLYSRNLWRLFRREGNADVEHPSIAANASPGSGFWLITHSGQPFDVDNGQSVSSAIPITVTLEPGWNQIGNPFAFPIRWSSVEKGGRVKGVYSFDGTQFGLDTTALLQPWEGYLVFNEEQFAVGVTFPPNEDLTPQMPDGPPSFYELKIQLYSADGGMSDVNTVIGFHPDALAGGDHLDFRKPSPIGEFVRACILEDSDVFMRDFKPLIGEGQYWDILIDGSGSATRVHINISETGHPPGNFTVYVFDLTLGRSLGAGPGQWNLNLAETSRLRIVIGTPEYAQHHSEGLPLTPLEFVLGQNYPNPFNPTTMIGYQLGKQGHTILEVYDLLGQRVRTLVDEVQPSGVYRVEWDGRDAGGVGVATGIYLVRLRSGELVHTKKMLLLR